MDRRVEAAKFIIPAHRGIEIGPYHGGLTPKRLGYQCLILDVFDTERLLRNATEDPYIDPQRLAAIEPVDLVGSATEIAELVEKHGSLGTLDYVLSSHNFEHLPDPITFLLGCEKVLKPGGMVSMILPDRRVSFDHFRPHSTTADFLEAFLEKRKQPTQKQVFTHASLHCHYLADGVSSPAFQLTRDLANVEPFQTLAEGWQRWKAWLAAPDELYRDIHCWMFTPSSLELILRDLSWLGVISLEVVEITELRGHEFFVHLRKPIGTTAPLAKEEFYLRRKALLRRTNDEAGSGSFQEVERRAEEGRRAEAAHQAAAELEVERHFAADRIAFLEAEVTRLAQSKSWRMTQPLRSAAGLLRRLRDSL